MFSFGKSAEMRSEDLKAVEWSWKFVKLHLWNYNTDINDKKVQKYLAKIRTFR